VLSQGDYARPADRKVGKRRGKHVPEGVTDGHAAGMPSGCP